MLVPLRLLGFVRAEFFETFLGNPSSFGRFTGAVRRYPGGTENANIFRTLSRETPN